MCREEFSNRLGFFSTLPALRSRASEPPLLASVRELTFNISYNLFSPLGILPRFMGARKNFNFGTGIFSNPPAFEGIFLHPCSLFEVFAGALMLEYEQLVYGCENKTLTLPSPSIHPSKELPASAETIGPSAPDITTSPCCKGHPTRTISLASQRSAFSGEP